MCWPCLTFLVSMFELEHHVWTPNYSVPGMDEFLVTGTGSPRGLQPPWHLLQGKGHQRNFWRVSGITQVLDGPTWGDAVLDALLKNKEELVRSVIVNRSHDCNDPDTEEFKILGELGRRVALDLTRESCGLFREEVGGRQLLWDPIVKGKDAQKG